MIDTIQKSIKNQRYIKKFYNVKKNSSFYRAVKYFNSFELPWK